MSKPKKLRKLIKAAKMGKPYAMYQLGLCYESGKYMEQNGFPLPQKQAMLRL